MGQNQKRRVQTTQLCYSAAMKYKKPTPVETGRALKYAIQALRHHPEKLTKWYQEQGQETVAQTEKKKNADQQQYDNAMQEWLQYGTNLGGR